MRYMRCTTYFGCTLSTAVCLPSCCPCPVSYTHPSPFSLSIFPLLLLQGLARHQASSGWDHDPYLLSEWDYDLHVAFLMYLASGLSLLLSPSLLSATLAAPGNYGFIEVGSWPLAS